jgi:small GTP-binding protein
MDREDSNDYSQTEENYDEKVKIMVLGDSKIGKTSLISRYCNNEFLGGQYLSTVGIDFQVKYLEIDKKTIRLQIWDTAGQERYRNIAKSYFQSTDGFVIVYDITNEESFEKLDFWFEQINTNAPKIAKTILFGNKSDMKDERKVSKEEGEKYAKDNELTFFEVSAKDGSNVNEAFEHLVKDILNHFSPSRHSENRKTKRLTVPVAKKAKNNNGCC